MKVLVALFTTLTFTYANAKCVALNNDGLTVAWKAFKTPAKAGVGGEFKKFELKGKKQADSVKALLSGMSISIDHQSVHTKNASRDKKITKNFMSNLKGKTIEAKVTKVKSKSLTLALTMNGITKKVPLKYAVTGNSLKANGVIDVLDFQASKSLKAINKACYALHEGKTWADVELEVRAKLTDCQ